MPQVTFTVLSAAPPPSFPSHQLQLQFAAPTTCPPPTGLVFQTQTLTVQSGSALAGDIDTTVSVASITLLATDFESLKNNVWAVLGMGLHPLLSFTFTSVPMSTHVTFTGNTSVVAQVQPLALLLPQLQLIAQSSVTSARELSRAGAMFHQLHKVNEQLATMIELLQSSPARHYDSAMRPGPGLLTGTDGMGVDPENPFGK
jgi:hypothetical protein